MKMNTKNRWTWILGLSAGLLIAGPLLAQNGERPERPERNERPERPERPERRGGEEQAERTPPTIEQQLRRMLGPAAEKIELTDAQKEQLEQKLKSRQESLREWDEANRIRLRDAREQMQAARRDRDQEAAQQTMADARKLMQERRTLEANGNDELINVLTPEQQKTLRETVLRQAVDRGLRGINLTEAQQADVDAKVAAGALKIANVPALERPDLVRTEAQAIVASVRESFSEVQQAEATKAQEARRAEMEQRRKEWEARRAEFRERMRERANNGERGNPWRERGERGDRGDRGPGGGDRPADNDQPAPPSSGGGVDF